MHTEGHSSHGELIYILFLYVSRLDGDKLSAPILLYAITLKDHADIKIRKEAVTQLERFYRASDSATEGLLEPFLESVRIYLSKSSMTTSTVFDVHTAEDFKKHLSYQAQGQLTTTLEEIEKVYQISLFALKFFKQEANNISEDGQAQAC